jgi:hypothetical protein
VLAAAENYQPWTDSRPSVHTDISSSYSSFVKERKNASASPSQSDGMTVLPTTEELINATNHDGTYHGKHEYLIPQHPYQYRHSHTCILYTVYSLVSRVRSQI